jgi:rhodanese-related sulfurtransferase
MRKTVFHNSCSCFLPVILFFAIYGSHQGNISVAQERVNSTAPKIQIVHPEVQRIPATELKDLLAKKADIVVIDVNPKDFFDSWHIPSAVNIPYNSMDGGAQKERKLKKIPIGKLIVLYCLCEEGADSSEEALELRRLGHVWKNVKVLEGGLIKWDEKGYPIYKQIIPD